MPAEEEEEDESVAGAGQAAEEGTPAPEAHRAVRRLQEEPPFKEAVVCPWLHDSHLCGSSVQTSK